MLATFAPPAAAAPSGMYVRVDAEVGVEQAWIVERNQSFPGYRPSAVLRQTVDEGGAAYGLALTFGGTLAPGFVLAARAHVRILDTRWGSGDTGDAYVNGLGHADLALEIDTFPRTPIPLRLQAGIGPRWSAMSGGDFLVACRTCVFALDSVRGMTAYAGLGIDAHCRTSPCIGAALLVDGGYARGGHSAGDAASNGVTTLATFGATLAATLAFQ
jgi:hypothetical protein